MGAFSTLINAFLFIYFVFIAIVVPLIDAQTCLPKNLFPSFFLDLKTRYMAEYNDYLFAEKPRFFVGVVGCELAFQWPLAVLSAYGIAAGKSWVSTTCLMYGASTLTSMVTILSELSLSNKASDELLMVYYPFLGLALIVLLRGLLPQSGKTTTIGKGPAVNGKKRA